MKLFVVGMPGAGKTSLGKKLAAHFQLPFIDLDQRITLAEGKPINDIFSGEGETYFRQIEARILRETAAERADFLLSTGGGAPCFHQNMQFINGQGLSVFLDMRLETIATGLLSKGIAERPLLKHLTRETLLMELKEKYNARVEFYLQAKIRVELDKYDERPVVEAVEDYMKKDGP